MDVTKVWENDDGAFAVASPDGLYIGASKAKQRPAWIERAPDYLFGPETEWHGGESPVAPGQRVLCRYRGGGYYMGPSDYHGSLWQHAPNANRSVPAVDFVSYQEPV